MPSFTHSPGATLDYEFDWSDWVVPGDSVASRTVTAQPGLTLVSSTLAADVVTVRISVASDATQRVSRKLACTVTTANGQVDTRTLTIVIRAR